MVKFNPLFFAVSIVLYVFHLSLADATGKFDVEFYNVGQGHCVVARTIKNGIIIIIIDAGSSSTIGVDEITANTGKNLQLAQHILSSIEGELAKGVPLNLIITHADKDHLNLAIPFLGKAIEKFDLKSKLRLILGGEKKDYNTGEAEDLISFIEAQKIQHAFGVEFTFDENTLLWSPSNDFSFNSGDGERVNFISVKRETKLFSKRTITGRQKTFSADEKKNASSIVVKLEGGGRSVMITGDKTKAELSLLHGRYKDKNKLNELSSDVFLATHHGSEEDFSLKWMECVNPSYLIVSSGISTFFHPRPKAVCSKEVIDNLKAGPPQPWHPIRAYGNLSSLYRTDRLIPVGSGSQENFRSTPYSYSITSLGIYVTADQGSIKFSFDKGSLSVTPAKQIGHADFETVLKSFINAQKNDLTSLAIRPPSSFSSELISLLPLCTALQSLDLSGCNANDSHTDGIVNVVTTLTGLSTLNLTPNNMNDGNKNKIRQAWGYRGLNL